MSRVLIVDDERELCYIVATLLGERGHEPACLHSGEEAILACRESPPDLVLLDLRLDGMDGLETLRRLRAADSHVPIVMLTAFGNVQSAVEAMKLGATDFISKPFNNQALLATIDKLLAMRREVPPEAPTVIGESPAFRKATALAYRFAVPDINLLLLGETGTGKELFARAIHAASKRHDGPFVPVDCSMLAESLIESELFGHEKGAFTGASRARQGRFELAQGGTLFLDEIGNLPVGIQAKLLRVLQERTIERVGGRKTIQLDVRVVSATNVDLKQAIAEGRFRQDLFYRLQEMTIHLPPLREREGDVRRLAEHFVALYGHRFGMPARGISESAMEILERYGWPGNVRELQSAMKSAVVLAADLIAPEHLPAEVMGRLAGFARAVDGNGNGTEERLRFELEVGLDSAEVDLKAVGSHAAEQAERSLLAALLRRRHLNGTQLARLVGVDPKTLRTKLRRYGLEVGLAASDPGSAAAGHPLPPGDNAGHRAQQ